MAPEDSLPIPPFPNLSLLDFLVAYFLFSFIVLAGNHISEFNISGPCWMFSLNFDASSYWLLRWLPKWGRRTAESPCAANFSPIVNPTDFPQPTQICINPHSCEKPPRKAPRRRNIQRR